MKYFNILFLILFLTTSAKAQSVKVSVSKVSIPTYTEPEREELPMFAENRVHQRSSGNPYPNKIVLKVNREQKVDKEYTLIKLENEYLELQILPEIGGKIYAAKDKTNGYDFFYKNHVIKPALIGALGSWISDGQLLVLEREAFIPKIKIGAFCKCKVVIASLYTYTRKGLMNVFLHETFSCSMYVP